MKRIHLIIIYILLCFTTTDCLAQAPLNQGWYWPYYSPNGVARAWADSTSEDWWYDIKAVPSTHPAFADGGHYIASGYSSFDDIGLGGLYSNDHCNIFTEINFNAAVDPSNLDLPDMQHMNTCGTIGLIDLTRTSSVDNPFVWIYNYGLGTALFKVIPTSDSGFLATGTTPSLAMPYPSIEPQFANVQTYSKSFISYQSPSAVTGQPNEINPFSFASCPPSDTTYTSIEYGLAPKNHACLLKVDRYGVVQWYYVYGSVPYTDQGQLAYKNSSCGTDLLEVSGGYLLSGIMHNSARYGNLGNHGFLLKVDANGMLQWINMYHDTAFTTEKFTAMQLKDTAHVYVTGERTNSTMVVSPGLTYYYCGHYPNGSSCLNGSYIADLEHHGSFKFLPFIKKIDLATGAEVWDLPLETNSALDYRVRNLAIDMNDNLLVPISGECTVYYANGECKNSYVDKVVDYGSSAAITQKIDFGPVRAFDLATGLGVKATSDGGFAVVGTKKAYNININKDYTSAGGYNMTGFSQAYAQTDAFVAKCNSAGNIEWTTIFDAKSASPGGDVLTNSGNPKDAANLDSWMSHTTGRSKKDIKRQECLYAITTSPDGEIIIGGNMSSNIDDGYVAMVENSCDLTLSNHLIQAIPSLANAGISITNMDNFIASNINTGRVPGNTHDVASFDVNNGAVIKMTAGEDITLYDGSDLEKGTSVDAVIDPSHTCSSGPIYSYSKFTGGDESSRYSKGGFPKADAPAENAVKQITVIPNPTSGWVTVKHPKEIKGIEVFDMFGKSILKSVNHDALETRINLSGLPAGVYILRIQGAKTSVKLVKL